MDKILLALQCLGLQYLSHFFYSLSTLGIQYYSLFALSIATDYYVILSYQLCYIYNLSLFCCLCYIKMFEILQKKATCALSLDLSNSTMPPGLSEKWQRPSNLHHIHFGKMDLPCTMWSNK